LKKRSKKLSLSKPRVATLPGLDPAIDAAVKGEPRQAVTKSRANAARATAWMPGLSSGKMNSTAYTKRL
jgi:hypothetical protein